jgi:hypothetical protein
MWVRSWMNELFDDEVVTSNSPFLLQNPAQQSEKK